MLSKAKIMSKASNSAISECRSKVYFDYAERSKMLLRSKKWQEVADNSNGRYKTARGAALASYYADAE